MALDINREIASVRGTQGQNYVAFAFKKIQDSHNQLLQTVAALQTALNATNASVAASTPASTIAPTTGVTSLDALKGDVQLSAGPGITIVDKTPTLKSIRISASGGTVPTTTVIGIPGIDGEDGETGFLIPGVPGPAGGTGATGPQGPSGFALDGLDADEPMMIPGVQGPQGNTGTTGATGPIGFGIDAPDPDEPAIIPGTQGAQGNPGATGPAGPIGLGLDGIDGEDGIGIPGLSGTGTSGSSTIVYYEHGGFVNGSQTPGVANRIILCQFQLPGDLSLSQITIRTNGADATNLYSVGIYNSTGSTLVANTTPFHTLNNTIFQLAVTGAPVSLSAGLYYFAWTGAATTGSIYFDGGNGHVTNMSADHPTETSTAGALPASVTIPALTGGLLTAQGIIFVLA